MALDKSIVIVNEYTVKNSKGKGSRGSTPGAYIQRYMNRDDAVEATTNLNNFISDYMARDTAIDKKRDDVAFSDDDLSLSFSAVKKKSKEIQRHFDNGKTVLKTVISFEEEYLRKNGIIDENFKCIYRGDYRGNIDQMKLRGAIANGLKRLSQTYDDLEWIGVIQVDTKHVHCHLCMVDAGEGNLTNNGQQKGKMTQKQMNAIRRGIDSYLDENQTVKRMCKNIDFYKKSLVNDTRFRAFRDEGFTQLLVASLPNNTYYWSANSHRKDMQKANNLAFDYVEKRFISPEYRVLTDRIRAYTNERAERDNMTEEEAEIFYEKQIARVKADCVNGIYSYIKEIPEEQRNVITQTINNACIPFDEIRNARDDQSMFMYRLRSKQIRAEYHKDAYKYYKSLVKDFDSQEIVSDDAMCLRDYFDFEYQYHKQCYCKYVTRTKTKSDEKIAFHEKNLKDLRDAADAADDYTKAAKALAYNEFREDFEEELFDEGMRLSDDDEVEEETAYSFDDVKALDIHHLNYDFGCDVNIKEAYVDFFTETTLDRTLKYNAAYSYLTSTGQSVQMLDTLDVERMLACAKELASQNKLNSGERSGNVKKYNRKTVGFKNNKQKVFDGIIRDILNISLASSLDAEFE